MENPPSHDEPPRRGASPDNAAGAGGDRTWTGHTPAWSTERFYLPRPEWVWDPSRNPNLSATATLRAHLPAGVRTVGALTRWLRRYRLDPLDPAVFLSGGAALSTETVGDHVIVSFISGGQDALESLQAVVEEFHRDVLGALPDLAVRWEELPLRGNA